MKIDAKLLQDSLSFLGLAISKNVTSRPITKMLELCTEDGFLIGTTCDVLISIRLKICPTTEELKALVEFDLFNNIIKSCSDEIELKDAKNALSVKSPSMKCKVPSSYNRPNTSMPHIPMVDCNTDADLTNLSNILPVCKSIINPTFSVECYRNIFFKDKVMATDTDNVALIDSSFFSEDLLLSYQSVEILSKLTTAKYTVVTDTHVHTKKEYKKLYVQTDKADIVCISNYTELFQYDDLANLFSLPAKDIVSIRKEALSKGYSVAKLFKNAKILLVFDTDGVSLRIDNSDFTYNVGTATVSNKFVIEATEDLMKKILTLPDIIEISILDNMLKCKSGSTEEIFSVIEIHENSSTPVTSSD